MFSGIVEKIGVIEKIKKTSGGFNFTIKVKNFLHDIKIGDSISCDGVCLTIIDKKRDEFRVELMPETLRLTRFSKVKIGDQVNLEKSLKIGDRINGHFVMGHVDGAGEVKKIEHDGIYKNLIITAPRKVKKYLAYKGSISVNGVSLTIAGAGKDWFKVCLITHTLNVTNLSELKIGSKVNLEIDMLARYLESLFKD